MDRIIDRLKPLTDEQLHLQWIYNRLIMQYGERPDYDYMIKLMKIIDYIGDKEAELKRNYDWMANGPID